MCPDTKKIPASRSKILTKDAKQMVTGPYYCPECKKECLQILTNKKNNEIYVVCKCGLQEQLTYAPVFQPVDYYNKFRDLYKKKKQEEYIRMVKADKKPPVK